MIRVAHKSVWVSFVCVALISSGLSWWIIDMRYSDRLQIQEARLNQISENSKQSKETVAEYLKNSIEDSPAFLIGNRNKNFNIKTKGRCSNIADIGNDNNKIYMDVDCKE